MQEFGHFTLLTAWVLTIVGMLSAGYAGIKRSNAWFESSRSSTIFVFIATALSISALSWATEPIQIAELYQYLTDQKFDNHIDRPIPSYDYKTIYDQLFNGHNGYLASKTSLLQQIKSFVTEQLEQQ